MDPPLYFLMMPLGHLLHVCARVHVMYVPHDAQHTLTRTLFLCDIFSENPEHVSRVSAEFLQHTLAA